jgi:retron-type reverse transcriptase
MGPSRCADSYGYRPGKSAIDAVRTARERCWRYDWVLDLDLKSFFDSIDWELTLRAIRHHTDCPWVLLYIERWLKAPVQLEDGSVVPRTAGTPQAGVISPLLADLFLHYAFDGWMARNETVFLIALEDLVAGLARNAERTTDLAHRFAVQQLSDKPQAFVHYQTLLPRHPHLPPKGNRVTHVSGTICHLCLGPLTQLSVPLGDDALLDERGAERHDPERMFDPRPNRPQVIQFRRLLCRCAGRDLVH